MKKILTSISIIGITAAIVLGATMSYFSDTETSTGNSFSAGTLDLKISDDNEYPPKDGVSATWTMSNMLPGDTAYGYVILINSGTIEADHMEVSVENVITDPIHEESDTQYPTDDDMDKWMEITNMRWNGGTSILPLLVDLNGNSWIDLHDLEAQGLDNLSPPQANNMGMKMFSMDIKFHETAGNDFQGDVVESEFTFKLHQHSSQ